MINTRKMSKRVYVVTPNSERIYNQIFPDFFRSLKASGGSFDVLMPALARVFYETLGLSSDSAYFVTFLHFDASLEDELEVVYFESTTTVFDEYKDTLRATVSYLVKNYDASPRVVTYEEMGGVSGGNTPKSILIVPIRFHSTTYGYTAMYVHDKELEYHEAIQQIDFLAECVFLLALSRQGQLNDARFEHYLHNDYLTDLPNRNQMYESIVHSLQMAEIFFSKFAILSVKINGIKQINDSLGMMTGDMVMKAMGKIISDAVVSVELDDCTGGSLTGRMSGADFVVLIALPTCLYESNVVVNTYCEAITKQTRKPIEVNGHTLYLSTNVGAAIHPVHGDGAEELLRKAEMAKSVAKLEAPGAHRIYENFMGGNADDTLWLNSNLPSAIAQNQFEMFYQAKTNLQTGDVIGAEALIRWMHPDKGMLSPAAFIDFAERNNFGIEIDKLVLDMACKQINIWQDKGINLAVSVNISPKHFAGGLICDSVENALRENNVNPACLEIELLESIMVEDFEGTVKVISALRDLGVRVSLDDFGSGYSSLEYVAKLPIDYLKIDRTFSMNMETNPTNKIVLEAIVTLAKGMDVKTVVEGVENGEQLQFLQKIGSDIGQGFFINKPMPVADFEDFLRNK